MSEKCRNNNNSDNPFPLVVPTEVKIVESQTSIPKFGQERLQAKRRDLTRPLEKRSELVIGRTSPRQIKPGPTFTAKSVVVEQAQS